MLAHYPKRWVQSQDRLERIRDRELRIFRQVALHRGRQLMVFEYPLREVTIEDRPRRGRLALIVAVPNFGHPTSPGQSAPPPLGGGGGSGALFGLGVFGRQKKRTPQPRESIRA